MRIAILSDNFYPELSGISDSIITLAKAMADKGHFINFYIPKYSRKGYEISKVPYKELNLGENIRINRFSSLPIPSPTGQARAVIPTPFRWLKLKQFRPDIIHTQLFAGVGLEALLAGKTLKVPVIGTNHTAITEFARYSPIKTNWFKKLSLRYAVWYYNQCNYVTAPSQSVFTEMIENGFHQPHQVISNPIDTETFNEKLSRDKRILKKEFNLSENTVIYAGRLASEKNIDVIIRAIALVKEKIPAINFAVAGHGSSAESLKNLTKDLHLENQIKFYGTVDKGTLAKLYSASEIFTITSTSETQSLTLMQAMACGLPAIGARSRALPEYINDKNGLLIEPSDHRDLAEKIIFLIKNQELREKLGTNAALFAKQFSTSNIAEEWEKLYSMIGKSTNK